MISDIKHNGDTHEMGELKLNPFDRVMDFEHVKKSFWGDTRKHITKVNYGISTESKANQARVVLDEIEFYASSPQIAEEIVTTLHAPRDDDKRKQSLLEDELHQHIKDYLTGYNDLLRHYRRAMDDPKNFEGVVTLSSLGQDEDIYIYFNRYFKEKSESIWSEAKGAVDKASVGLTEEQAQRIYALLYIGHILILKRLVQDDDWIGKELKAWESLTSVRIDPNDIRSLDYKYLVPRIFGELKPENQAESTQAPLPKPKEKTKISTL
jgi:hypothetical protein